MPVIPAASADVNDVNAGIGAGAPANGITDQMAEAGEEVLLAALGGAVEVFWCPREVAISVYLAMRAYDHR